MQSPSVREPCWSTRVTTSLDSYLNVMLDPSFVFQAKTKLAVAFTFLYQQVFLKNCLFAVSQIKLCTSCFMLVTSFGQRALTKPSLLFKNINYFSICQHVIFLFLLQAFPA